MFFAVRPIVVWLLARYDRPLGRPALAAVLLAMLLSAAITETIGIHAIFGAFLLGAIIPHESELARNVAHKLGDLVTVLLLPAFFAVTGMRTQIALVSGWQDWLLCAVMIAVATLGKFGGTLTAARLTGSTWRTAAALGVLMNTRGLMGLIVLTIGLDLRVISPTIFAMSVITAIVTTVATSPILHRLQPGAGLDGQEQGDRLAEVSISG
jgi:Kef-type K+ transport system membrane component KefB